MTTPTRPPQTSSSPRSESAAAVGQRRPRASPYLRKRRTTRTWTSAPASTPVGEGDRRPAQGGGRTGSRDHVKTADVGRLGCRSGLLSFAARPCAFRFGAERRPPCGSRHSAALGGRRSSETQWSTHRATAAGFWAVFSTMSTTRVASGTGVLGAGFVATTPVNHRQTGSILIALGVAEP